MQRRQVILKSDNHYGQRVPSQQFGRLLEVIPAAVRHSMRMRLEGRSRAKGRRPDWLSASTDIRFVGHEGDDQTILHFETETLGESAPHLYAQQELWPIRPDSSDTGFELLADVVTDIAAANSDSDRFDRKLLEDFTRFQAILKESFSEIRFSGNRQGTSPTATINAAVLRNANTLRSNLPSPRKIRICGKLDLLGISTQTFGMILDNGQKVSGILVSDGIESLVGLLNTHVIAVGKAIFRPSGRMLRIDAERIQSASHTDTFFNSIPQPKMKQLKLKDLFEQQKPKLGIPAIFGKWPGTETDAEIAKALEDLS
jgi:hypothetical protein